MNVNDREFFTNHNKNLRFSKSLGIILSGYGFYDLE